MTIMSSYVVAPRALSVRSRVARPSLPSEIRLSKQELIARVDERAHLICKWLLRDLEPDVAFPQYRAIVFTICLMERIDGNKLSGYADRAEYAPLYMRTRLADIEYNRLSKYFPVLWWDVLAQVCRSSNVADLSDILNSMEDTYRRSILVKMGYILNVVAFLNNLV